MHLIIPIYAVASSLCCLGTCRGVPWSSNESPYGSHRPHHKIGSSWSNAYNMFTFIYDPQILCHSFWIAIMKQPPYLRSLHGQKKRKVPAPAWGKWRKRQLPLSRRCGHHHPPFLRILGPLNLKNTPNLAAKSIGEKKTKNNKRPEALRAQIWKNQ